MANIIFEADKKIHMKNEVTVIFQNNQGQSARASHHPIIVEISWTRVQKIYYITLYITTLQQNYINVWIT